MAIAAMMGSSCSNALSHDDLVESYQTSNPDTEPEAAACVVDELVEAFEVAGVEAELVAVAPSAAFERSLYRAEFTCGATDDVNVQLTRLLIERDIAPDAADCVATALITELDDQDFEVLLSGEITDQFFDKYYAATYDCDALPGQ